MTGGNLKSDFAVAEVEGSQPPLRTPPDVRDTLCTSQAAARREQRRERREERREKREERTQKREKGRGKRLDLFCSLPVGCRQATTGSATDRGQPRPPAEGKSHAPRPSLRPGGRRGIVLIVVAVAILLISLAGLSFVTMMSTEHKAVYVHGDQLQLACLVDSGAELLGALSELPPASRSEAGGLLDNPELFRGKLVLADARIGRHGRFSVVSPNVENDEITGMRFGVENESARLNLAVLTRWEKEHPGAARDALMNLPGMTEAVADAILDWIDGDSATRQFGAEADYYAGLNVPYAPRNAVPVSLEELLLVRGVTRELLLGADANFNHQLEPEEARAAGAGLGSFRSGARMAWASLLTVCSAERNLAPQGEPRIDLNDEDLARLHRRLSEVFDPQWARFIILYRQLGPYRGETQAGPASAVGGPESPPGGEVPYKAAKQAKAARGSRSADGLDLSRPAKFKISTVLDLIGAEVQLPRVTGRPFGGSLEQTPTDGKVVVGNKPSPLGGPPEIVESPFVDDRAAMREYLPVLLDHATVISATTIGGRINVNLAPRAVLLGVPGLDGATVEQIVTARGSLRAASDGNRRHPTWLLTGGLVDLPQMKALMPYLTAGGDVFRAQIVGFFDRRGASARVEVVLDATCTPPRQVYYKDLRLLGHGYPLISLGAVPPRDAIPTARQIKDRR